MSAASNAVQSRQDRQAARLRGAGTAKIQNVGFRIPVGPALRTRTPARTAARTPKSAARNQTGTQPRSSTRRASTRTPMPPPSVPAPKSNARGRKSLAPAVDPSYFAVVTPSPRTSRMKPPELPEVDFEPDGAEFDDILTSPPEPSSTRRSTKRKSVARATTPPAKRKRKSLAVVPQQPSSSIDIASDESEENYSPEPSPPPDQSKINSRNRDAEEDDEDDGRPKSVVVRVHKLPPSVGGTKLLNEVDGLLQVVTEVLTNTAERVQRQDTTQAKILDAFTEEVTIRLIEMTDAWDSHSVLLGAIRKAQKRKNTLRQELLAIRRERAEIQREMEAVRQSHERGEQEMINLKTQHDFIADMEDLKARVPAGDDEEQQVKNGVEAALIELRPLVAGESGIAQRLAAFNRFLERFDEALAKTSWP